MDGTTEMRRCTEIRCGREMTVSIHHGQPTQEDLDERFQALGWSGYFCPGHAYLDRRSKP